MSSNVCHAWRVAGGTGYRRGVPLSQRPVDTGPAPTPPGVTAPATRQPAGRRHCWVRAVDGTDEPHPGLLLEWRQQPAGRWQALVVYTVHESEAVTLVQQWLAADLVAPA